jgi:hypothetical protein
MRHLLLLPLGCFLLGVACWACAADPFLSSGIECIEAAKKITDGGTAARRASAESCIAKLQDGGKDAHDQ